ncbi:MAG: protein tyrosine phosphatase [Verrucomicrobia bacterium]|nr:protein tyrosine phosphatase [Verrucomicrobiota bacterium]
MKLLFICSQNKIRSLTAEHMLQGVPGYSVKSAGTEPRSRIRVNEGHIGWADIIFVMEKKHLRILEDNFQETLNGKRLICLNIPDEFIYMEPDLIDELKAGISQHIELAD